jgi:SAM-dependent methyltransferase
MNKILSNFFDLYPSPFPFNVKERVEKGYREAFDIADEYNLIFPDKGSKKNSVENVLIFGCGHTEALFHALRNPTINFVGVDISKKAINSANKFINENNLNNIEIENVNLIDFNSNVNFDIIYANNVFQYLEDPIEGFHKSYSLLNESGALVCSLPSSYYFSEIDIIRKRLINLGYSYLDEDNINEAFNIVSGLGGIHPARVRMVDGDKFIDKKDFVSRFLVPIFSCFSISDIFSLINNSNFYFQSWYSNSLYYPSALLRKESTKHSSLYNRINQLPDNQKWDFVCEIFKSSNDRYSHTFTLRKNKDHEFISNTLLNSKNSFVCLRNNLVIKKIPESQETFVISSNYKRKLTDNETLLVNQFEKPIKLKDIYKLKIDIEDIDNVIISLLESSIINIYS